EVALGLRALLDDVSRLGPVHLEQAAGSVRERLQVLSRQRSAWAHEIGRLLGLQQRLDIRLSQPALEGAQRGARPQSVVKNSLRRLERVRPRQRLQHLHTTPM